MANERPTPEEVAARASAVVAACLAANKARSEDDKRTAHLHAEYIAAAIIADAVYDAVRAVDENGVEISACGHMLDRIDDRLTAIAERG